LLNPSLLYYSTPPSQLDCPRTIECTPPLRSPTVALCILSLPHRVRVFLVGCCIYLPLREPSKATTSFIFDFFSPLIRRPVPGDNTPPYVPPWPPLLSIATTSARRGAARVGRSSVSAESKHCNERSTLVLMAVGARGCPAASRSCSGSDRRPRTQSTDPARCPHLCGRSSRTPRRLVVGGLMPRTASSGWKERDLVGDFVRQKSLFFQLRLR